jgi:nitroimidazol reductase NimA-like FMN-containing flavoprotein (pyridoxamine 5'-phosphate oxidase superfamily)
MKLKGPWTGGKVDRFLTDTRMPIQIACNGSNGYPVLASLWFVPIEGKLYCATQRSARIISLISQDPRCAFELSIKVPPYRGVRGQGIATVHPGLGEKILHVLIDRYLGDSTSPPAPLLLARAEHEVAIAIEPRSLTSWDFTDRMRDAR